MSYSPNLGRWLQLDPIEFEAGDSNLYRYVGNNPTNRLDPSGLADKLYVPAGWYTDCRTGLWYRVGTSPTSGGRTGYKYEDIPEIAAQRLDSIRSLFPAKVEPDRPIDPKKDITTFNCAGLAFRDYKYWSKADTVKKLME